jgi:hypothetical protein
LFSNLSKILVCCGNSKLNLFSRSLNVNQLTYTIMNVIALAFAKFYFFVQTESMFIQMMMTSMYYHFRTSITRDKSIFSCRALLAAFRRCIADVGFSLIYQI